MPASLAADVGSPIQSAINDNDHEPPPPKRCGLVQCRKAECNLQSHRQYIALRKRHSRARKASAGDLPPVTSRHQPSTALLDHSIFRIGRQIEDGFPTLPFKHETLPLFRELAHHYFSFQIDRLIQIFSPHLDRRKYKSTMVEHALSNDVFCLCITANAKTDMLMRAHIRTPDRASGIVYATTANVLRKKLNDFKPTDLDWLLVLVVALVGFDLAFSRTSALESHHTALRQLIKAKGGIQAVGHVLPYVLNTDRHLAVFTGQYPIFKETPLLPPPPKDCHPLKPYGKSFESDRVIRQLDSNVLDLCREQCDAIHLMETSHISMVPKAIPASDLSVIPWFLYTRDRLAGIGACLHAEYHENQNTDKSSSHEELPDEQPPPSLCLSKSRCVLLATLIIDYEVLHANYYTIKGPFLADQLKVILEAQPANEWNEHVDMLRWILFVAAAVPESWNERPWAMQQLKHWLTLKYKKALFRPGWEKLELASLESFVWAESLNAAFLTVCRELADSEERDK